MVVHGERPDASEREELNMMTDFGKRLLLVALLLPLTHSATAGEETCQVVPAGLTWVVHENQALSCLILERGSYVMGKPGSSVTMTIDGVETGLEPGAYTGGIELTLTDEETVVFKEDMQHDFRQAIYLDGTGVNPAKSVLKAADPYGYDVGVLSGVEIVSDGPDFNGIYATGGRHTVVGASLDMTGHGGNDFAGYGAAIMSSGEGTNLVIDGANVVTEGAVRTAAVADKGSNLVVKNSSLLARGGPLPWGYIPNSAVGTMMNVPWMLGLVGNNRATNLLGNETRATYINSTIAAEEWGVLSVDASHDARITAINSDVIVTGKSGYGTYAIGNSLNSFYGANVDVPAYAAIVVGGHVVFAPSSSENVARVNGELELGLTRAELKLIEARPTTVTSDRFGLLIWGDADVKIMRGTRFDTGKAVFLVKSAKANIEVDGKGGTSLNPQDGIIMQVMETDNPGAMTYKNMRMTIAEYTEPSSPPEKNPDFDVTRASDVDVVARFSDIDMRGDFLNSSRGGCSGYEAGTVGFVANPADCRRPSGRNMVLHLKDSSIEGVISASSAQHAVKHITPLEWNQLGEITNTPGPAINNGVIVTLEHSDWKLSGTSYLTSLTIDRASSVTAAGEGRVSMTVNGVATPVGEGSYSGDIVLAVN